MSTYGTVFGRVTALPVTFLGTFDATDSVILHSTSYPKRVTCYLNIKIVLSTYDGSINVIPGVEIIMYVGRHSRPS